MDKTSQKTDGLKTKHGARQKRMGASKNLSLARRRAASKLTTRELSLLGGCNKEGKFFPFRSLCHIFFSAAASVDRHGTMRSFIALAFAATLLVALAVCASAAPVDVAKVDTVRR
jgi:hypothetical protein